MGDISSYFKIEKLAKKRERCDEEIPDSMRRRKNIVVSERRSRPGIYESGRKTGARKRDEGGKSLNGRVEVK